MNLAKRFLEKAFRDDTNMTSMKTVQLSRPFTPSPSTSKILYPLDLGRPISKEPLSASPNGTMHVNERHQNKNKTKSCHIQTDHAFDVAQQCNGIIKGWLHCLTSETKGRFLVNNILIFGSA